MFCVANVTERLIGLLCKKDLFGIVISVNFLSAAIGLTAIIIKIFCGKSESGFLKISVFFVFSLILSVTLSATDCFCGNGQFGGAFVVFFYNCAYALFLCILLLVYLFVKECDKKNKNVRIKSDDEIRGEIRNYFKNKNPFAAVEKDERLDDNADEINYDYVDKLIDKLQKHELSAEDKKTVEEIRFFIAAHKGGGNEEKSRFSDYMTTLMFLTGKYDSNAAITSDVLSENDKGDTNDTFFRYGDDGSYPG